jgi:hypothetical protein
VLRLGSIRGILVDVYLRLEDDVLNSDVTGNKKISAIGDATSNFAAGGAAIWGHQS